MSDSAEKKTVIFKSFIISILISFSGLMVGLDLGVISGALGFIAKEFNASTLAQEWIVGIMLAGAAVGSIFAGWKAEVLGRKRLLIVSALCLFAGSGLCAMASSVSFLLFGRTVMGIGLGIAAFAGPVYIAELVMEEVRGLMGTFFQFMITIGILLSYLGDYWFSSAEHGWRWMFGIDLIPAAIFLISIFFLPNDPRWLLNNEKVEEAFSVLRMLRHTKESTQKDIKTIQNEIQNTHKRNGFQLFSTNINFRRSVYLGILLQAMQQLAGINAIINYAPTIFKLAGYGTSSQLTNTIIIGVVNILSTFLAMALIDKWGRKPILYTGFGVMAISMALLGYFIETGAGNPTVQLLSVIAVLLFIVGFAMSIGPLAWVLCAEIQPASGRDFGVSVSTLTNWVTNMIVSASFLSLLEFTGYAYTFWIFAAINLLFIFMTFRFVPETKGVPLDEIEHKLMDGVELRNIGR